METLKTVLVQMNNNGKQVSEPCSALERVGTQALTTRYGDFHRFLTLFNPKRQAEFCDTPSHIERCFSGSAPTLVDLRNAYGSSAPATWLVPQLDNIATFSGAKQKMSDSQVEDLADTITINFFWLKVTELMVFFQWFKSGRYGKFYGAVDPLTITNAIRSFLKDRNDALMKIDQKERERKQEEDAKDAISFEQYAELCRKEGREPNPLLAAWASEKTIKTY